MADIQLSDRGISCDRITHAEVLSADGTMYTGYLRSGRYSLMWISTPNDWKVRINNHKTTAHWHRILEWIQKADNLEINIVIFGVHGYLWSSAVPKFMETIIELPGMRMQALRLCHHKDTHEKDKHSKDERPNGARLRLATTIATNKLMCPCTCNVPIPDHKLVWY
jgi:hypothetical protein